MKRLLVFILTLSILTSCKSKSNCGTKRQHKKRYVKMQQFAPGMAY